jgi:hypothetical protein
VTSPSQAQFESIINFQVIEHTCKHRGHAISTLNLEPFDECKEVGSLTSTKSGRRDKEHPCLHDDAPRLCTDEHHRRALKSTIEHPQHATTTAQQFDRGKMAPAPIETPDKQENATTAPKKLSKGIVLGPDGKP